MSSLTQQIQHDVTQLLATPHTRGGQPYSYADIADQIAASAATPPPTAEELARLETGGIDEDEVSTQHLQLIAAWAGRPAAMTPLVVRIKLHQLRQTITRPDGQPYTLREIADQIAALGYDGPRYSYLSQLANGTRSHPGMQYLQAIATWAGVPVGFFFDDPASTLQPQRQPDPARQEPSEQPADEFSAVDEPFAAKARRLFDAVKREDGTAYTGAEVAEEIGVSAGYLESLLNGDYEPGWPVVNKLAEFFGVELEFFATSERSRELNRQYELLARLGENNVSTLAARASELSPDKLRSVLEYIDFQANRSGPSHD